MCILDQKELQIPYFPSPQPCRLQAICNVKDISKQKYLTGFLSRFARCSDAAAAEEVSIISVESIGLLENLSNTKDGASNSRGPFFVFIF